MVGGTRGYHVAENTSEDPYRYCTIHICTNLGTDSPALMSVQVPRELQPSWARPGRCDWPDPWMAPHAKTAPDFQVQCKKTHKGSPRPWVTPPHGLRIHKAISELNPMQRKKSPLTLLLSVRISSQSRAVTKQK